MSGWLRAHSAAAPEIVGLHVLEQHVRSSVRDDVIDALVGAADAALRRVAGSLPGGAPLSAARVVVADVAEDALASVAASVDALIVGRIAPREGMSLVRLGRVARHLLRRVPVPVMVVPPDLRQSAIGSGPIVLATDLGAHSVAAGLLARRLANEIGRPLVIAHVVSDVQPHVLFGPSIRPQPTGADLAAADIEAWIAANDLAPATAQLVEGDTVERLMELARKHEAPFVVCGSRRLSMVERIFSSSVGMELARHADRGVLVVP
jgi:nucleotide-binding universal stress UspA family protein